MDLLLAQLLSQARRVWKYRWLGLSAAWLLGLAGLTASFLVPNVFEARARIYVDTQSILKPLMAGLAVQPNVDMQVQMLTRTLITRPNIEKLVRMADLDLQKQTKAEQEAQIDKLMKSLSIATTGRDNLYTLAYKDEHPETAKKVVQSLVSIFVESSLGASRKDTATATTFINEQIKSYEAKLEEAEQRLKEFRLRNLELTQSDGKDATGRLAELHSQLERAKLELREAENSRDAARKQLDAERSGASGTMQSLMQESAAAVATPEIDARLADTRRNLDGLLQRYTEAHPDVVALRKLVRDLEEQKKREVAELRKQAVSGGGASNTSPVQMEMQRMLASAEVQVAALRARVNEYQARYGTALASMRTAPQLEAEAAQLNRDYEIHKQNYNSLVARRESATMSGELDVASGVADFKLIEPPRVAPQPVAPNRFLLLTGAMALALAGGLLTAFAASQLRPVFFDVRELREKTELPILGVVSRLVSDEEGRRARTDRLRVIGAGGSLVLMFLLTMAVLVVLQTRQVGERMASLIEQAAQRLEQLRKAGAVAASSAIDPPSTKAPSIPSAVRTTSAPSIRAAARSKQVDLDLPALAAMGLLTPSAPRSRVADQYRVIKRPLIKNAIGKGAVDVRHANLIMVTSALAGEGKSFTSLNLAMSMAAELDHTVMLVDADVARPSLLRMLGLPPGPGLLDVLGGQVELADVLLRTNIDKLTLLPSGTPQPRATELLASESMSQLLDDMANRYPDRIIIFDSPPLLLTTESRVLASHLGQIVLVVHAERTPQAAVQQALATIEACPVKMLLLNQARVEEHGSYGYGYGYGYGYEHEESDAERAI